MSQTYPYWELIIVDNFSQDKSDTLVKSFSDNRIQFFQNKNFGVIATSRNFGISKSKGEFIAFLDSDDWWSNTKLERGVSYLSRGYDFVYTDFIVVNSSSHQSRIFSQRQVQSCVFSDLLYCGNPIACSSVILKKSLITSISGFSENPNLVANEDFDAWLRISKISNKFIRIASPDTFYSLSNDNFSASPSILLSLNTFTALYFPNAKRITSLPFWLKY